MAVNKRMSMRDKIAKRSSKTKIAGRMSELTRKEPNSNPHIFNLQKTKKEKPNHRPSNFTNQVMNKITFNTSNGISKSAVRRRKRKEKEQLVTKMDDLLTNLPVASKQSDDILESEFKALPVKKNLNIPNAVKNSGNRKIIHEEQRNFTNILRSPDFQSDPFAALKAAISQNISSAK